MRYLLTLFAGLWLQAACLAQDTASTALTRVTRVNFLLPGVSYETPVGQAQSLYVFPHLSLGWRMGYSSSRPNQIDLIIDPGATVQYRYFYSRAWRAEKGKRIEQNTGDYIAALYNLDITKESYTSYSEERRRPVHTVGAVWGMQRNRPGRFSFDACIGAGYYFARGTTYDYNTGEAKRVTGGDVTLLLEMTFGFWLGQRDDKHPALK